MATRVKVTREELYEQVWSTPISKLARQYGISDVALAKTCRRMNVPRPGRGYWQQLAANVKMSRPRLPKSTSGHEEWVFPARDETPASPKPPTPRPPTVTVADTLHEAHPVAQRLGRMLARADVDQFGRILVGGEDGPILAVTPATHRRALLLLDALCRAVDNRGHRSGIARESSEGASEVRLFVRVSGETFGVSVEERLDRRERAPNEDEVRRAEIAKRISGKAPARVHERFACGRLQLFIRGLGGTRSSWSDGKEPIERHLGRVVVALEGEIERRRLERAAQARAREEADERRRQQEVEAERKRREEEAERRREAELAARRHHQRLLSRDLRSMARRWAVATEVRAFLSAVEGAIPVADRGEGFTAWLRWAQERGETLDPLNEPHKLAKVLEPVRTDPGDE